MARKQEGLSSNTSHLPKFEEGKLIINVSWEGHIPDVVLSIIPGRVMSCWANTPAQCVTIDTTGKPWTTHTAPVGGSLELHQKLTGVPMTDTAKADRKGDPSTVSELCDRYLAEGHIQKHAKSERSWANDRSDIKTHIRPKLGPIALGDLTKPMVEIFVHEVATCQGKVGTPRTKGGRAIAARCMSTLGAMLNWGHARGFVARNATQGIERIKLDGRERFLTMAEMRRLGTALDKRQAAGDNIYAIAALRLLMLTGARRGEILGLEWDWIDFEHRLARLPYSKTGAKVLPLGDQAIKVLRSLPHLSGSPYVLPRRSGDKPLREIYFVWNRVREAAELADVRIHDLRHSFASAGVSDGTSLYVVGKLLGHRHARTTQRYAHLHDNPVREAANRISSRIAAAMAGDQCDANVVSRPEQQTA